MKILKFGLIGKDVQSSLSPKIHLAFAKQFDFKLEYSLINAVPNEFSAKVSNFFSQGGNGLNVTTPFKSLAYKFVNTASKEAKLCQSVNTIAKQENNYIGYSTDGPGFIKDLTYNLKQNIASKNILIIGAGGAISAILPSIIAKHPKRIFIYNRTKEKALAIINYFNSLTSSNLLSFYDNSEFDILINGALPNADYNQILNKNILASTSFAYDLNYQANQFQEIMKSFNINFANGYGMLKEQAALSFNIWTNLTPNTKGI